MNRYCLGDSVTLAPGYLPYVTKRDGWIVDFISGRGENETAVIQDDIAIYGTPDNFIPDTEMQFRALIAAEIRSEEMFRAVDACDPMGLTPVLEAVADLVQRGPQ